MSDEAAPSAVSGTDGKGGTSVLESGAPPPFSWVPNKHRVNRDDGSIDLEGSYRKTAASYIALVQRMGDFGTRPHTPEEYTFEDLKLPPGIKAEELKADPQVQAVLKAAHEHGLTDSQMQWALGEYYNRAVGLLEAKPELEADDCEAALQEVWPDERAMSENLTHALRATTAIGAKAGLDVDEMQRAFGNNPQFVRLMAAIGSEMREDRPPPADASGANQGDFDAQVAAIDAEFMKLTPYDGEKRAALNAQKLALFERRYGTRPVTSMTIQR